MVLPPPHFVALSTYLGHADKLYPLAFAQIAKFDRWFAELKKSRGKGIRDAGIEALRKQVVKVRKASREIAEVTRC